MNSHNRKKGFACVLREMAGPIVPLTLMEGGPIMIYAQWSWNGQLSILLPTNIVSHLFLFGRKKKKKKRRYPNKIKALMWLQNMNQVSITILLKK